MTLASAATNANQRSVRPETGPVSFYTNGQAGPRGDRARPLILS